MPFSDVQCVQLRACWLMQAATASPHYCTPPHTHTHVQVLRPPHGVALVAAKSHYFGVGGGTAGFAAAVKADGTLEAQQVWVCEDGASNKREILKLRFPDAIFPYFQ